MTRYLIFDNSSASFGTQKELIINWDNVKYIQPVNTTSFKIQLNNGGDLNITLSAGYPDKVIKAIQDVVRANPSGRELMVSPDSPNAFVISGITFTPPATLSAIPNKIDASNDTLIFGSSASNAGPYNTGFGFEVMESISAAADSNVAIGTYALQDAESDDNVAIGYNAMRVHKTGNKNVAIGYDCMETSGDAEGAQCSENTFVGADAGKDIDEDCNSNVGIGRSALQNIGTSLSSCNQNTALGTSAGSNLQGPANNNTLIGYDAEPTGSAVSNEFTLGNSSVAVLRCQQTTITALSDERDKKDIEDLPYGLDFVDSLKPKRFVWDNRAETRLVDDEEGNRTVEQEFFSANKGKKDVGFIAQELQTVDDDFLNLVYDSNPERLEASYGKLIPVLVKAIQELKAQLDNKQDK